MTEIYDGWYIFLSSSLVWPPGSQSLLIMGWCISIPEHRLWIPLDCVPIVKDSMFPVRDDLGSFLFPPSEICPCALFFSTSYPSPLRSSFSLLYVHKRVFSRRPPVSGPPHRPSPIVRLPESYQPSSSGRPMSSSGFLTQRPICRLAPPSPDLYGW